MIKTYYPEMDQPKLVADYEAKLSHSGKHYYVKTPKTLKGRGIEFLQTYTKDTLTPHAQDKVGWNSYRLTRAAFDSLTKSQDVSMEILLD